MKLRFQFLILGLLVTTVACTKATPDFDLLDQNAIPQPKFNGSTIKSISTSSGSSTYVLSGTCDPKISNITGMAVGLASTFASLNSLSVSTATISCSSGGTFSFELKSLTALGYSLVEGQTYEVQLRATTSAGQSNPSYIRITYSTGSGGPRILLGAGGIEGGGSSAHAAANGPYKALIRVNNYSTDGVATGAGYKLKMGSASRN